MNELDKAFDESIRDAIYDALEQKVREKIIKWSDNPRSYTYEHMANWAVMLAEETGEVARAVLEGPLDNLEDELYDVAIVAVFWLNIIFHIRKRYNLERE
jgi:NTP pyrophosphatase (non-canonical NTP hydrolase)